MDIVVISVFLIIVICSILSGIYWGWKKGLMIFSLLMTITLAISTYMIIKDVKDIQSKIMSEEKLFVLKDGKKVVSAFSIASLENITEKNTIHVLTADELKAVESDLSIGYTKNLKAKYYRTIVFEKSMFDETLSNGLSYDSGEQRISLTKSDFETFMTTNDPEGFVMGKIVSTNSEYITKNTLDGMKNDFYKKLNINTPDQLKGYGFILMIADFANDKEPIEFVYSFKNREIEVYPKSAVFRFVDTVPNALIGYVFEKVSAEQKQA